jgi:hypothetical protein
MMPEIWIAPKPDDLFQALAGALAELDLEHELNASARSYTTGSRYELANYWGTRGATRKRLAEAEFLTGRGDWRRTLWLVLRDYELGLRQGLLHDHWLVGQYAVLKSVVGLSPEDKTIGPEAWWWDEACRVSLRVLGQPDAIEEMWARSSLADLCMVALREEWPIPRHRERVQPADVVQELARMIDVVGGESNCPALWPTFRQFWRWRFWWRQEKADEGAKRGFAYLWPAVQRQVLSMTSESAGVSHEPRQPDGTT